MAAKREEMSQIDKCDEFDDLINLLEAALYVAGRPLDLKTLGSIIKTKSD